MLDWRRVNDDGLAGTGVFKSKIQFDDEDGDPGPHFIYEDDDER